MYRFKDVKLRKFRFEDIPLKIEWVNCQENNEFLGYDLPLEYEKTCRWFESIKDRTDRWDAVVEYQGRPVGLTGLLSIDRKNRKASDYIMIGDLSVRGLGIGMKAGQLNLLHAYHDLDLQKLYGYIEAENIAALKRTRRMGGHVEGYLRYDRWKDGHSVDSMAVAYYRDEFRMPEDVYWEEDEA